MLPDDFYSHPPLPTAINIHSVLQRPPVMEKPSLSEAAVSFGDCVQEFHAFWSGGMVDDAESPAGVLQLQAQSCPGAPP